MSSVTMRVDVAGSDGIPHTFLVITQPDGHQTEYGQVPKEGLSLFGPRQRMGSHSG